MNRLSNIELHAIFKKCKNKFPKEPDFDSVVKLVENKLDIIHEFFNKDNVKEESNKAKQ